jgi:hypothetical protein
MRWRRIGSLTMERTDIVRTAERSTEKFREINVLGLNIFRANRVDCSIGNDPRIAFVSDLCGKNDAALNIGNLFDYADGPDELFDGTESEGKYRIVATGCYSGQFYDAAKWDTFPALFFDHVSDSFFRIAMRGDSFIRKLLQIDAIAYFVSPRSTASVENIFELLNSPFESSDALIEKSLDFFKLVGFSHADGDYFSFAARSKEDFLLIDEPLASAVNLIESSEWYRENMSKLDWDEGYSECLTRVQR